MKTSRFQFKHRDNASKLHKAVGNLLRKSNLFGLQEIYQEYPVSRVNDNYSNNRHHFDWVIPKLNIVIEAHGMQHYQPVSFGGNIDESAMDFAALQKRDKQKKEAALAANYIYIEISYLMKDKLTEDKLLELIELGKKELSQYNKIYKEVELQNDTKEFANVLKEKRKIITRKKRESYLASEEHKRKLAAEKKRRKEQYEKRKNKSV